jgi:hypothetical protein
MEIGCDLFYSVVSNSNYTYVKTNCVMNGEW